MEDLRNPLYRLSVDQYHRVIDEGILGPDDRVELLEGFIAQKPAKTRLHRVAKLLLVKKIDALIGPNWFVDEQTAVTAADSEPEPDVTALRGDPRDYLQRHPQREDTGLLAEISDTSLQRDRQKKRIYARAGFPVYWIVNIPDRQIEVHTQPSGP
jgi:Uma2 family endonuclease